jgi:hypothetical protein
LVFSLVKKEGKGRNVGQGRGSTQTNNPNVGDGVRAGVGLACGLVVLGGLWDTEWRSNVTGGAAWALGTSSSRSRIFPSDFVLTAHGSHMLHDTRLSVAPQHSYGWPGLEERCCLAWDCVPLSDPHCTTRINNSSHPHG